MVGVKSPSTPIGHSKTLNKTAAAVTGTVKETAYAAAHGFAAWCHEVLFVRGGAHVENRVGEARHAHAAIANGRDDAIALARVGFALGMSRTIVKRRAAPSRRHWR
jgi:hypothetical protein